MDSDDGTGALALQEGLDLRQVGVLQHVQQLAVVVAHLLCSSKMIPRVASMNQCGQDV